MVTIADLTVFPLCLGGNVFGWTADEATSFEILDAFIAGGGNFIDTADVYSAWVPGNTGGDSERIIGAYLTQRACRDQLLIATKVAKWDQHPGLAPATIAAAADSSLSRLACDHIDLYYAHQGDPTVPLADTIGAFDDLIRAGKIRHYGLSNFSGIEIEQVVDVARAEHLALPIAVQPEYNLVARAEYERDLAPILSEQSLVSLPYYGLASGFLTGKYRAEGAADPSPQRSGGTAAYRTPAGFAVIDALARIAGERGRSIATVALAWLLSRPTVAAPIASASKPEQVPDLLAAASVHLTGEELAELDQASASFA